MRTAVITAPGQVDVHDIPVPDVGDSEVLVRVAACGLCTMEANLYAGRMNVYPSAAGHEISGYVEKVGPRAAGLEDMPAVGSLVVVDGLPRCGTCRSCRAGQSAICVALQGHVREEDGAISMGSGLAEYVKVHASRVWAVGDADPDIAAMGEPLACVIHSLHRGGFRAGDRVTVIGAGFMGHLHLAVTRHLQARSVAVVERDEQRLAGIAEAGADAAVTPDRLDEIPRADLVFVTIASKESIATALEAVADGGRIVLFGGSDGPPAELPGYQVHRRQLTVTGSFSHEPGDWREAAELLAGGALAERLRPMVTARYPLDEVESALKQASQTPVFRVVVQP